MKTIKKHINHTIIAFIAVWLITSCNQEKPNRKQEYYTFIKNKMWQDEEISISLLSAKYSVSKQSVKELIIGYLRERDKIKYSLLINGGENIDTINLLQHPPMEQTLEALSCESQLTKSQIASIIFDYLIFNKETDHAL